MTGEMVQNEQFSKLRQTSKLTRVKGHIDQVIWSGRSRRLDGTPDDTYVPVLSGYKDQNYTNTV